MQNAVNPVTVERERERERESCSLKAIANLACVKGKISLQESKLYIIYRKKKLIFTQRDRVYLRCQD